MSSVQWYCNVFGQVPRRCGRWRRCKAIHAQGDRVAAETKARDVVAKLRKAAELVEQGVAEILSYYAFPEPHWRRIRTNNPLERLRGLRGLCWARVMGAF